MNRSLLIAALLCAGPATATLVAQSAAPSAPARASAPAKAESAYERAVREYVQAAQAETEALTEQFEWVVENQSDSDEAQLRRTEERLGQLQQAFEALRRAPQGEFDQRKSAYESARGEYQRAIQRVAKPAQAAK
jgi:hypothetical protein